MPAECLLVFVDCIPWVTPGCNEAGGYRAEVVGQETYCFNSSTFPVEGWKSGCWPEIFAVSNTSKEFILWWLSMPHSCSTYCIQGCWHFCQIHGSQKSIWKLPANHKSWEEAAKLPRKLWGEMKDCRLLHFHFFQKWWHFLYLLFPRFAWPSSLPWAPVVTAIRARMHTLSLIVGITHW